LLKHNGRQFTGKMAKPKTRFFNYIYMLVIDENIAATKMII